MQVDQIHRTLTEITEAVDSGAAERSLTLARLLKREMLGVPPVDPVLYGWARFYELKSLYTLARHGEALELLESTEPVEYAMSSKNVGWLHSVGSELAMHLGRVDGVLAHGQRCLEIRRAAGDFVAMAQCAITVCNLLQRLDRADRNGDFALELVSIWRKTRAERALLRGARRLLDNVAESRDPALRAVLAGLIDDLLGLHDDRFSDEAGELVRAISQSDWFFGVLEPGRRAELEREAALAAACRSGDIAGVRALLDASVCSNARDDADRTPLIHAAFAGHAQVVKALLERGALIDAENIQRRTALVLAADQGHVEIVELLLAHGADPNHAGIHDQTALHVAGWQGHLGVVRVLLARGADPERLDATGNTALTLASTEDQPEVVRSLVLGGARIDATTPDGHTALMKAAMEGQTRAAGVLIELGASARLRDRHGLTAADWARQEGFLELGSAIARSLTRERGRA